MTQRDWRSLGGSAPIGLLGLALFAVSALAGEPAPDVGELARQIEGESCRYSSDPTQVCVERPSQTGWFASFFTRFHPKYDCPLGAARCLEKLGPAAREAVPALVKALGDGPNDFDTGDGVIGTRSAIASALGAIGDPRAIDPLAQALKEAVPADRGSSGAPAGPPAARHAIVEALGKFGEQARGHWALVAAVLAERNADEGYLDGQRAQFEYSEAVSLAAEELRAANPGATSFAIDPKQIEEAKKRLDRSSPRYIQDFERRSADTLASAAAEALGRFRAAEALPVLVEALDNPAAAEAAARAIAELGEPSGGTRAALQRVLASDRHGPRAKAEAARALQGLGAR